MSALMGSRKPGSAGILFYHRVAPRYPGLPEPGLNVTPDRLRLQLEGLLERGFGFIPLRALLNLLESGSAVPPRTVVLTFDDAFAGVFRWALPILRDLDIPATVFAVTGYVGRSVPMHFDVWGTLHHDRVPAQAWRSMTWSECQEAEDSGLVEIGCHTHAHINFTGRLKDFEEDIAISQALFAEYLGGTRPLFAVPYGNQVLGQVDEALLAKAALLGLTCALTTTIGLVEPGQSPFGWKRLEVVEADNGATLAAKIEGWYDWMGSVKGAVHRVSPW
jgi:peptidoglycan/xylan/chitin deacetylase (PgdA/CDA1 family)